jgi:hypothetical protein
VRVLGQFAQLRAVQLETEYVYTSNLKEVEKLFSEYDESLCAALSSCRSLRRVCLHWHTQNWKLHNRYQSELTRVRFHQRARYVREALKNTTSP